MNRSHRDLEVDVAPDRADDVAAALRALVERLPVHPAIVPVIDAGVSGGRLFVAVRPHSGEPLDAALEKYGPADIADALPRLRVLADAIDLAARHALHHGRLTPRQIVIDGDDTRLEGIGVAAVLLERGCPLPTTGRYAAPEVVAGSAGSPLADQYALATIAREWLFGRIVGGPADEPIELPPLPDVDMKALTSAFATALTRDPADRFGSCTALVDALQQGSMVHGFKGSKVQEFKGSRVVSVTPRFWAAAPFDELPIYPTESGPAAPAAIADSAVDAVPRAGRRGAIAAVLVGGIAVGAVGIWLATRSAQRQPASGAGQPFTDAALTPQPVEVPPPAAPAIEPRPSVAPPAAASAELPNRVAAARQVSDAAAASRVDAGLLVHSSPEGAAVSIDGIDRGTTPVAVRGLPLGTRTVVVTRAGYRPSRRQITLTSERPSRTLEVDLTAAAPAAPAARAVARAGDLVVDSRPAGAGVSINGRPAGVTPLTLALGPGTYTVRIERAGYRSVTTTVEVIPGQRARVAARLEGGQEEE